MALISPQNLQKALKFGTSVVQTYKGGQPGSPSQLVNKSAQAPVKKPAPVRKPIPQKPPVRKSSPPVVNTKPVVKPAPVSPSKPSDTYNVLGINMDKSFVHTMGGLLAFGLGAKIGYNKAR